MPNLAELYARRIEEEDLDRDPAQVSVVERLDALRDALLAQGGTATRSREAAGVYLWGPVGRGKSMLLEMLVGALDSVPCERVHFHAFMRRVHAELHEARERGEDDPIAAAADAAAGGTRLIALDEMEVTDIVDAMIVGRVFERLLGQGVVFVVTSNRPPDDLYRDGLKRDLFVPFVRLLEERLEVVELAGPDDYRGRTAPDDEVFLVPAGEAARARMDELWSSLGGGGGATLDLGHGARVATNGAGAARAAFAALCDRPLGSAEYLRLAREVELVLIDDVPRMGERHQDAARRFITLVDVLYDAGAGLVASAEDVPERLHLEGEGSDEFVRTASRLREMQSPEWPGRAALR